MARITVEDCLENVDNMFELVLVAAKRSRRLANGAEAMVPWQNDKPTVVALREIAAGLVGPDILNEAEHPDLSNDDISLDALAAVTPQPIADDD